VSITNNIGVNDFNSLTKGFQQDEEKNGCTESLLGKRKKPESGKTKEGTMNIKSFFSAPSKR
jgi:hypothetical protein